MDELRPKQKKFVQEYIANGGNATQAVKDVYDVDKEDDNTAGSIGSENLSKPKIKRAIASLADSIPNELVVSKHLELLNKMEKVTKNNMTTGKIDVIDTGEIDAQAVKAGLDMAYKLKGSYVTSGDDRTNVVIMPVLVKFIDKNETNSSQYTD